MASMNANVVPRRSRWKVAIAILNIGGMNDNVQQETQRVDQDVPLATLDLLARVVARRIKQSSFERRFAVCSR